MKRTRWSGPALAVTLILSAGPVFGAAKGEVRFNHDIRPIMSDTCFLCHGPDAKSRKAKLRLDIREDALKPAKSGEIPIVPGRPEASEIIRRIFAANEDDLMPPPSAHKELTAEQKESFRRWVAEGAEYQGHWAFAAAKRPAIPKVTHHPSLIRNPIDHFIFARLAEEKLSPSPEADRVTLIRRLSLDLTGIPPTQEEVDAFLADRSSDAYEKLVDRLLTSPRYGEHMAARWLDSARYADSNGFQSDTRRHMWHWRDWVINAFNRNQPFDQFTIEQLAGDLLPGATREQIVATGFNRNHRLNGEGGRIVEEWFAETVIDRVETTGLTWMALTLNCCRCHDHKYDPISQKEFYQIFAFFNSNNENGVLDDFGGAGRTRRGGNSRPVLFLPSPEQEMSIAQLEQAVAEADAKVAAAKMELPAAQTAWEPLFRSEMKGSIKAWTMLEPKEVRSDGGAIFVKQGDGSFLATGINPPFDQYLTLAPIAEGTFSGLLLEVFPDDSLPNKSLGRYSNGNFVLTDVIVDINAPGLARPLQANFTRAEADYNQKGYEVKLIVEGQPKGGGKAASERRQGWAIDGPTKREARMAMFTTDKSLTVPPNATISVTLRHDSIAGHNIGRFRLSTSSLPPAMIRLDGANVPPSVVATLDLAPGKRTAEQRAELAKFYRENTDNPLKRAEAALTAATKALDDFSAEVPTTMVMEEVAQPREARILNRGEYDKPGDVVPRALPAILPSLPPDAPANRLGLAKWLVSGEHPLTARVWANREWERFFGTGLVKTTENFGMQSEPPSHPELLDWLATEFVRLGWNMKAMQKLIVMSATYRQSSKFTPQSRERDPENRLLARGPRFRLGAEVLRDQALAASGLLVEKIGGPSVNPYMPEGVWDETSVYGDMRGYKPDLGDGLYRRTLYTVWKRTAAPPTMMMFDSPSRELCTVKRPRTNTPLQALALLNELTYVEAARALAQRMMLEGGVTPADRIAWGFRRVTSRHPESADLKLLTTGLEKRLARYRADAGAARKLIAQGESKPDPKLDPAELAAYTLTANVLLNLDEVVTKE